MEKILTSEEALNLINSLPSAGKDDHWKAHSICVGNAAAIIAKALNLDCEKAKVLGYIHDIGKSENYKMHDVAGYDLIKKLGYEEEYAHICLTHSYLNNDVDCVAGGHPPRNEFRDNFIKNHQYTIYEKIINLCDLMCKKEVMTVEKRMIDLLMRKGVHDNTYYHIEETLKLKDEIENKLGFSVYDLFPTIKEHL